MQLRVFPQQLLGAFILDYRRLDADFHDLVPAFAGARVQDSFFAQTEFLPIPGPLRDFEQGAPIDRGDFDLGPQTGFVNPDRHGDFDVVAFAPEEWVRIHADRDVQVACGRAEGSSVAFARNPQARALLRPWRNTHVDGFGFGDPAIAVAIRAAVAQASGSLAARARQAEAHRARHLGDIAAPVAFGTGGICVGAGACSVTNRTRLLPRDAQAHLCSADRLPEIDVQPVFEIRALLRRLPRSLVGPAEPLADNVLKIPSPSLGLRASALCKKIGEVESSKVHVRLPRASSTSGRHPVFRIE